MQENNQIITIKGTKEGLTVYMDDDCSFEYAMRELDDKVSIKDPIDDSPPVKVTLKVGKRYITNEQQERIQELLGSDNNLHLDAIESDVVDKQEALAWKEESDVKVMNRIIRSGQALEVTGDLLLVGDVNPGGNIRASGNIYVMGALSGVAHAGIHGDSQAIIAASYMKPSQLRIADYISRAPDYESDGVYMEYGRIDEVENKIVMDQLRTISKKKQELSGFERRMYNG